MEIASTFIEISRTFLSQYLNGIKVCFAQLTDEDIWWRPNEESNSIGNLMLHTSGTLRHWIVSGIGGAESHRVRQQEFDERARIPKEDLLSNLNTTVEEALDVLDRIDPSRLMSKVPLFGEERTWLYVIYHNIEHFSMHAGQILMITKLRTAKDLGLQ